MNMATEHRQSNQNIENSLNNEENSVVAPLSNDEKTSPENSEYDSVESYSEDEEHQVIKARSKASDLDSHSENEGCGLEREEGDGQESVPAKKVDDDEDKKNPQYIPKRGTFYEHDDRTAETEENIDPTEVDKPDKDGKKKVWQDKKEKWSHDRFNDNEQAPKSRAELIAIYGYDIRNEDGPPRARRRRRYGRGPNKYTRNWEDEDAYNKAPPLINNKVNNKKSLRPKQGISREEFPPLGSNHSRSPDRYNRNEYISEDNEPRKSSERFIPDKENKVEQVPPPKPASQNNILPAQINNQQELSLNRANNQRNIGSGRTTKPKEEIKDSDYRGFTTKGRIQRNMQSADQKVLPASRNFKKEQFIQTQNFTNKNTVAELEKNMSNLNVEDGVYKGGSNSHTQKEKFSGNNQSRQGSVPPRLQQSEQKGSKRYSSMRQRSLPETATPPAPNFPHSFYPTDYNSQAPPPASTQPIMAPPIHPATTQLPPPALAPMPQQVAVTAAPILQAQFPPPFPQPPPTFIPAGVPPPAFIASQTPQIINYVQGQPAFTPGFPGYQQQFNPVTQPTELYQPQGGITYYSTDQQQLVQRPTQKRPKAAIPIVDPTNGIEREQQMHENQYTNYQETCSTSEGNIQYDVEQQE